jgi:hypothetical protein
MSSIHGGYEALRALSAGALLLAAMACGASPSSQNAPIAPGTPLQSSSSANAQPPASEPAPPPGAAKDTKFEVISADRLRNGGTLVVTCETGLGFISIRDETDNGLMNEDNPLFSIAFGASKSDVGSAPTQELTRDKAKALVGLLKSAKPPPEDAEVLERVVAHLEKYVK